MKIDYRLQIIGYFAALIFLIFWLWATFLYPATGLSVWDWMYFIGNLLFDFVKNAIKALMF